MRLPTTGKKTGYSQRVEAVPELVPVKSCSVPDTRMGRGGGPSPNVLSVPVACVVALLRSSLGVRMPSDDRVRRGSGRSPPLRRTHGRAANAEIARKSGVHI